MIIVAARELGYVGAGIALGTIGLAIAAWVWIIRSRWW